MDTEPEWWDIKLDEIDTESLSPDEISLETDRLNILVLRKGYKLLLDILNDDTIVGSKEFTSNRNIVKCKKIIDEALENTDEVWDDDGNKY